MLRDQVRKGLVVRNVVELVDRIPSDPKPPNTLTAAELQKLLAHVADRYGIAWQLALSGLRRGEVAGLRWADVDLDARTLRIEHTRLRLGKNLVEDTPKSTASRRTLPLPDHLVAEMKAAKGIQAADRLALGEAYQASGFVVANEAGEPLSPHALTSRWARTLTAAGVRHVRLHDARHTCGTLMHLVAFISAWLGHASKAFTLQTYVHSQPDAWAVAAQSFGRMVGQSSNA